MGERAQIDLCEVGLAFHEEGRFPGLAGDFEEPLGVAALAPPDHHHGVDRLGQASHLLLASLGRIADGLEHFVVRVAAGHPLLDPAVEAGVLGRLGDDDRPFEGRQPFELVVEEILTSAPSIVLADYRLREGTAFDLLAWLKAEHLRIPLIVLTAYAEIESAVEAVKNGRNA